MAGFGGHWLDSGLSWLLSGCGLLSGSLTLSTVAVNPTYRGEGQRVQGTPGVKVFGKL